MEEKKEFVAIDIERYPELAKIYEDDPAEMGRLASGMLKLVNDFIAEKKLYQAEDILKMGFPEIVREILEGFLDVKQMLSHHADPDINVMLYSISGVKEHPFYQVLMKDHITNANNEIITFEQKYGVPKEEFSLKGYISQLMFFSWYCSLGDLATFLSGANYKGLDNLQDEYFLRKIAIQPSLKYQADHGLMVGKLISGTGFFDIGIPAKEVQDTCYACKTRGIILIPETKHRGCKRCFAGYKGD